MGIGRGAQAEARGRRARRVVVSLAAVVLTAAPSRAAQYAARVQWAPSTNPGVVRYQVFRRTVPGSYGVAEPGTAVAGPDGTFSLVVTGLDVRTDYGFAVQGYTGAGTASPLSNEIRLGYAQLAPLVDSDGDGLSDAAEDPNLNRVVDPGETDPLRADTDGDGVGDARDACQGTPAGVTVDAAGCSCLRTGCDDGDPCTADVCTTGVCTHTSVVDGAACSSGSDFCAGQGWCRAGVCVVEPGARCDDGNACTADACDDANRRCMHRGRAACCAGDADCADTDACTVHERCAAGACVSDPLPCADARPCVPAACDPRQGCVLAPLPDGTACSADDACTAPGTCAAGTCVPAAEEPPGPALAVRNLVVRPARRGRERLVAHASFHDSPTPDPTRSGVVLELRDAGGARLYDVAAPAAGFRTRRRGGARRFLFVGRAGDGLRRLVLRVDQQTSDVRVEIVDRSLLPSGTTRVSWLLRLGERCLRAADLVCAAYRGAVTRCR